jgi:hypothetical protein
LKSRYLLFFSSRGVWTLLFRGVVRGTASAGIPGGGVRYRKCLHLKGNMQYRECLHSILGDVCSTARACILGGKCSIRCSRRSSLPGGLHAIPRAPTFYSWGHLRCREGLHSRGQRGQVMERRYCGGLQRAIALRSSILNRYGRYAALF